jgi:hypothetical protein
VSAIDMSVLRDLNINGAVRVPVAAMSPVHIYSAVPGAMIKATLSSRAWRHDKAHLF